MNEKESDDAQHQAHMTIDLKLKCVVCGRPPSGLHFDCAEDDGTGKQVIRFISKVIQDSGNDDG